MRSFPIPGLLLAFALACSTTTNGPAQVGTEITDAGGVVESPDGLLRLAFPAGAVGESTFITVDEEAPTLADQVSMTYDFGPDGARFDVPVTLTFQMDGIGEDEELFVANLDGADPVEVEGSAYDPATGTVTAPREHFSRYGIFRRVLEIVVCTLDCIDAGGTSDWCLACCESDGMSAGGRIDCSMPPRDPVDECIDRCVEAGMALETCRMRCAGPGGRP